MLKDYSGMKHIELSWGEIESGFLLASCTGNNFGDRIIHYRMYVDGDEASGFDEIGCITYHEGSHPSLGEMRETAQRLAALK